MYIVITSVREKNHLQKITDQKDLFLDKWLLFILIFPKCIPTSSPHELKYFLYTSTYILNSNLTPSPTWKLCPSMGSNG